MSSSSRSTVRTGGKNTAVKKNETAPAVSKAHKNEAKKTDASHVSHKATAEQIRMAQTTSIDSKVDDDPKLAEKIKQVMEVTNKSEDEVRLAFHDCDNDPNGAVEYLLSEHSDKSEWSVSKKKRRAVSTTKPSAENVANNHINDAEADKEEETEPSATGNGGPPTSNLRRGGRRGGPARTNDRNTDNRKWKGKENKENERNASDSRGGGRDGFRRDRGDKGGRGMANGSVGRGGLGRGGRGSRGGGRLSSRTYQPRGDKPGLSRTIETWNNPSTDNSATEKMGNWENDFPVAEEWDNEEYTGSLADTKVFTPSSALPEGSPAETTAAVPTEEIQEISNNKASSPQQQVTSGVMGITTLTAAQTQFFSQLTQQSQHSQHTSEPLKQPSSAAGTATTQSNSYTSMYQTSSETEQQNAQTNSYQSMYHPSSQSITSTYSTSSVPFPPSSYGNSMVSNYNVSLQDVTSQSQSLPPRNKPQRARVPPPSKIPSSAVEMPPADGSVSSNIGFLDVQFGGLEFGTNDSSFDSSLVNSSEQNKYNSTTSLNTTNNVAASLAELSSQNAANVAPVSIDPYSNLSNVSTQQKQTQPSNVSSVLNQGSKSLGSDSLLQSSTEKQSNSSMGNYSSQTSSQTVRSTSTTLQDLANAAAKTASVGAGEVPSLSSYGVPDTSASYNQQTSGASVYQKQSSSSVSSFHPPSLGSSYNASSYSNPSQVTSSNIPYSSGGSQSQGSSYTPVSNSSYNSQQSSYPSNSYQQSSNYSNYPSYPNTQVYQNNSGGQSGAYQNQSSYGSGNSSSLSGNSSSYGTTYPNAYNSSNSSASQQNHKISSSSVTASNASKESQVKYDSGGTAVSTAAPTLASLSQTTVSSTKVSSTSTGTKSGMVASLPPGVPPMMGAQYIMSQSNVPYFQQPIYSFEELQMIQQRLPPMPAGYYDISAASYQAPTSLAAGRDGLPNTAYSMSDARFTRTDNNASPVSSTISQQNASQAHQQPLMNPAFQPSYATYYIAGTPSMLQPNFFGPSPLYPMTPTAATAGGHSTTSSGQYGKGPGAYGAAAGYGTGYDANGLSGQTASDYGKNSGGYANSQSQTGKGVATTNNPTQTTSAAASDLTTANMHSKTHSVLTKVNSYDKQGFHSGTPPPFPMPGSQSANAYPQVFISSLPPSNPIVQQHPLHVDLRNPARRTDSSNTSGSRAPATAQPNKTGAKPMYGSSPYWSPI